MNATTENKCRDMVKNSAAYRARVIESIAHTKRLLTKEKSYSPAFQKADMIASYEAHIAKLTKWLA